MRSTYRVLAILVSVGVVLQAAWIGLAWFTVISDTESGIVFDENSEFNIGHTLHSLGGLVIPVLCLALLIVAFFAKIEGGVKWAAIVVGVAVLQVVLGIASFSLPAIGALHGINAFVLAGVAGAAAKRAGEARSQTQRDRVVA